MTVKNIIIWYALFVASVSALTYFTLCDYMSANACRNYVIAHQDSLQWHPVAFPYSKHGGCFVVPLNDYGMGYYTDMTIQRIDSNSLEIIAWSDRSKFLYRWKKVDRVYFIDNDSLLMSVIRNKMPKDTVVSHIYDKGEDSIGIVIEKQLNDTIRAIIAKYPIDTIRLDAIQQAGFEKRIRRARELEMRQERLRIFQSHLVTSIRKIL